MTSVILLPLLASLLTVTGQLLYKIVARWDSEGEAGRVRKWTTFAIANLFFAGTVASNYYAFKYLPLFIVYSFTALNYVLVTIVSSKILGEDVRSHNYLAVAIISFGVFLVAI